MAIVFGSPEAKAILDKDKEKRRLAEEEAKENSVEALEAKLRNLDEEIAAMENELAWLNDSRELLAAKLADAGGRPWRK